MTFERFLCRAKRFKFPYNLVEGYLYVCHDGVFLHPAERINPDTVLQCTGLRDANGKLIFDGDRVRYNGRDGFVQYGKHAHIPSDDFYESVHMEWYVIFPDNYDETEALCNIAARCVAVHFDD